MSLPSNPQVYEKIGDGYRNLRIPDRRIASAIHRALGDAVTVCNVGAGAGSYEPLDRQVTAVEPSPTMIQQRSNGFPVIQAVAEQLPFADKQFDVAMAVLTVHHWTDAQRGLKEMQRVSRRQVVFAFDPTMVDSLWLVRDYLPEVIELENRRALPIHTIIDALRPATVEAVPIPWDCTDGFQAAYWRRPEEYLRRDVRAAISSLAQLPQDTVSAAITKLKGDLESESWHRHYSDLLALGEKDFGYRLIVSDPAG